MEGAWQNIQDTEGKVGVRHPGWPCLFLSCFYQHTHVKHRLSQDCEKSAGKWAFSCGNNSRENWGGTQVISSKTGPLETLAVSPARPSCSCPPGHSALPCVPSEPNHVPRPGQRPTFMPPTSQPPRSTPVLPVSFWGRNRARTHTV